MRIRTVRGRPRGTALLLALFFLVVTTFLASAFLVLLPTELSSASRLLMDSTASLACDAGIQDTISWIRYSIDNGSEPITASTANPPDYAVTRTGTIGDFEWTVTVTPDAWTPPRSAGAQRAYLLSSIVHHVSTSQPCRRVSAWIMTGESFAKWARFVDRWPSSDTYTFVDSVILDGPYHINDPLNFYVESSFYSTSGQPPFRGTVSSAAMAGPAYGDGVHYYDSSAAPYDYTGNPIPGRYERMFSGGRAALQTGVQRIELPPDSVSQSTSAWGSSQALPTTDGVYVNANGSTVSGGIYIRGDVAKMQLGVDASGNATVKIQQAGGTTTVTKVTEAGVTAPSGALVASGSTLVVGPGGTEQVLNGQPNGVIYATGSIQNLSGVNKGAQTIAVDTTANKEIVMGGSVTRADTPPGEPPTGTQDRLGLVCYNLRIPSSVPASLSSPLQIYAAVMAGRKNSDGGVVVDNTTGPAGRLEVYGSLVESQKHIWGYSPPTTGYINWRIYFDTLLTNTPPPVFPTTGGKATIRSWAEESLLQ